MSVNVYDKTTGDLQPLTSMFASPVVIDVEELPSIGIEDAIYRLASDSWSFRGLELSADDMTVNTASFEAIGCTTAISGGIYTYTPNTYYIRYWGCNEAYAVSNIQIDSADGAMVITGTNGETLLQTTIETGSPYPFYISQKWVSVSATLSHTNMSANITALTGIGFTYSTDNITYVYTPQNCRFKYNGSLVSKIVITAATGNMKIYDDSDTAIYDQVIVDGPYSFMKASSVTYWVGNSQSNKLEQIATIADISSFSSVSSLQDIFNTNPEQNVSGAGNVMSFANAGKKTTIKSDSIEVSHDESGTQKSDFKVNASKISMSDVLLNALKNDLGIYDVEAMGATVELDDTAVSKNYIAGDLLINDDTLYRVTAIIAAGDPIVKTGAGANVEHVTFEELLNLKQNKTLSAAMTIDGVSASTVEAALTALNTKKLNVSLKGAASGLAELDAAGKVPEGQLPSYVDDVIEGYLKNSTEFYLHKTVSYDAVTPVGTENPSEEGWYEYDGTEYVPTTDTTVDSGKTYYEKVETYTDKVANESGKIYIDLETEKSYRWGGTFFVNTGSPLALGETSDTAYRGDRGKIAYDDSQLNKAAIAKLLADISESEEETAIHEHAIGDYLLLNDELQVVIAAIEIGDTLVENTNIRPITIDEALKNLRIDVDKKQNYIFRGTHDEWDALTTEQKAVYDLVAFTDDLCADGDAYIAGSVVEGDLNAVSGGAVYNELYGRKFIVMADSYGNYKDANNKNFIDLTRERLGFTTDNFIDLHAGSAGFTRTGNIKFLTMLQNLDVDRDSVTDIIVFAGANDVLADYDTNVNAIAEFATWVEANMPKSKVRIGHPGLTFDINNMTARLKGSLLAYRNCDRNKNMNYIKNSEYVLCSSALLMSDNVHPTAEGVNQLSIQLCKAIKNGECDVHYYHDEVCQAGSWNSGYITSVGGLSFWHLNNGQFSIGGNGAGNFAVIKFNTPVNLTGTMSKVLTVSDSYCGGSESNWVCPRCSFCCIHSNGTRDTVPGSLWFHGTYDANHRAEIGLVCYDYVSAHITDVIELDIWLFGESYPTDI